MLKLEMTPIVTRHTTSIDLEGISMSRAAVSVFAWGIYMLAMGATFLLIPNAALPIFGFPPTDEIWIRGMAMLAVGLGYFYIQSARHEIVPLFRWKVHGHIFGVLCMVMFVILQLGPPTLLLFASADLLAAVWTGLALHYPRGSAIERAAGD
jgi:hypothetical protein